ncbi:MAG: bifunctional [glutamate--ammonia ligase]-adenylyl-L-tyrosine phosphorylase/[glutamate--ammonia-ligase] adenylyltransferase [Betaproteobacteria bacterium]
MEIPRALAFSRYAARATVAEPALADWLMVASAAAFAWEAPDAELAQTDALDDPDALAVALRRLRRRVFLHTLVRDLAHRAPLTEVCATMTRLAELTVSAAVKLHARLLAQNFGEPLSADDGTSQRLIVLGMGKLGGGELNVSSDIDLIFVYPEAGETAGPRKLANREFFDRLGQRLIGALDDVTAEGYVFRVDTRLRPYGESGPLTTTFNGLEAYLVTQGRTWERYAWLKARALTGTHRDELDALVVPFVYRKYLDYDAYDGLRDVHRQIRDQALREDHRANVKLGEGGIREIEFIVQALQIVRGGREPDLRVKGTLPALAALEARGLLPSSAAAALHDAYVFLRRTEHRLQYRDDQQTHQLPAETDERALLAESMDFAGLREFEAALRHHRAQVSEQFAQVFGASEAQDAGKRDPFAALWEGPVTTEAARGNLAQSGFTDPEALIATLGRVRASSRYLQLPVLSRQRFDTLVPQLLAVAAASPGAAGAQEVFGRLLTLLEAVSRRSAYLALVIEHPPLLPRIAQLMGASAWAADYLTQHPILLDELLDARVLLAEPDWGAWRDELARQMAAHAGDIDRQMDTLRHFHDAQTFRLLAQDLGGRLTVERLADHVSALADVLLAATLDACWAHLSGPPNLPKLRAPRFAIIGYGKLGGKELGYASDLDIVFLYDVDSNDPEADILPERYARLAQRLITWITSNTAAGQLYDTDLRLRPDGAAGLLVSSLTAFRKYQRETAWTWEHQALTRARFVAGDAQLGEAFEAERETILRLSRDPSKLADDVADMRRKMAAGHPNRTVFFDIKHDPGGMVDIEFTVQYLVLALAHRHPALTRNAGNIALLGLCAELKLLPLELATEVADAYRDYRRLQHQVRLTGAPHARVEPALQASRRIAVAALWKHVFGAAWEPPVRPKQGQNGEIG